MKKFCSGNNKGKTVQDVVFVGVLLFCVACMLYRAFHSIGDEDEHFYIFTAFRLVKGDRLLVDEWHLTQMASVFLYLPLKIYYVLTGSTTGIVLFSRLIFVAVKTVVAVITYAFFRNYDLSGVAAAIVFFLNIPLFFIMALYYTSLLCLFLQICSILMLSISRSYSRKKAVCLGVFFAMAIISAPYMVFLFAIYTAAVVLTAIVKKDKSKKRHWTDMPDCLLTVKTWFFISLGLFTFLAFFFVGLCVRNSVKETIQNLPMIFYDAEFSNGVFDRFGDFFGRIERFFSLLKSIYSVPLLSLCLLLLLALAVDRKRLQHRTTYFSVGFALYLIGVVLFLHFSFVEHEPYLKISYLCVLFTVPYMYFGFLAFLLSKKGNTEILKFLWIFGIIGAFVRAIESEMGYVAGAAVIPVGMTGSTLLIGNLFDEIRRADYNSQRGLLNKHSHRVIKRNKTAFCIMLVSVVLMQFGVQLTNVLNRTLYTEYVFDMANNTVPMDHKIEKGPLKGLYAVQSVADIYYDTLSDLDEISKATEGPVMIPKELCWVYMYLENNRVGSYSGYVVDAHWIDFDSKKMALYYQYHPERYPEYIYIPYYDSYFHFDNTIEKELLKDVQEHYVTSVKLGKVGYILSVGR